MLQKRKERSGKKEKKILQTSKTYRAREEISMKTMLIALTLLIMSVNVAYGKEPLTTAGLYKWADSTVNQMCEYRSGMKLDKYTDGIFDCDDWARNFNKWVRANFIIREAVTACVTYDIGKKDRGHALSMVVGHDSYFIVDPRNGTVIMFNSLADVWLACASAIAVLYHPDGELPDDVKQKIANTLVVDFIRGKR